MGAVYLVNTFKVNVHQCCFTPARRFCLNFILHVPRKIIIPVAGSIFMNDIFQIIVCYIFMLKQLKILLDHVIGVLRVVFDAQS